MTKPIDKLAWIHSVDRKVLCARSRGNDTFYFPGGKREENESDQEALVREIQEELAVDLVSNTIDYVNTFAAQAHGKAPGVMVQMTCYTAQYNGELTPSSEIEEIAWLGYGDKEQCSLVAHLIFDWLHERGQID